ncbi:GIY-YIG nuclease family protein [Endozoicomonas gorgoniicola]|uniref:GIY-YIG nuclease family protein n=1 Tax=Endozoicomonas gorgoniicola TaxID=1234144 RepID=A0ABT3MU11_9GAMM|nr:GIY-YIG nuclease family protein [Endozoicomonas gorgoniicola]MCW7552877.1 GIY-YIG nuclease family protein [Endozoicomonas gorgoniicola]
MSCWVVNVGYKDLKTIVDRDKRDWVAALESQKAVYLINDTATGKMYVGSATGDNGMLLQRWKNYVSNGHGGNKDLVSLVAQKGFEYVKANFTYSILENYNSRVGKDYILQREFWWMETLGTKAFGYNN